MRTCSIDGCNNKHYGNGLCNKHYQRYKKCGHKSRTIFDSNEFILYGDYFEIVLYNISNIEVARTKVSMLHLDLCRKYKWGLHNKGYVMTTINRRTIFLHDMLLNTKGVDHRDGDKLNNLDNNIRPCTTSQNNANKPSSSMSGLKGAYLDKRKNKWYSSIKCGGKTKFLGYFDNKYDAALAYGRAAEEMFGEFAYCDNIDMREVNGL